MTAMTAYVPGQFCWVDLATPDSDAAKAFYGDLLGWTFDDRPSGPDRVYTMCLRAGEPVCALYRQCPDRQDKPPFWKSYVSVASVDHCVAKAQTLGGTVVMPAVDVFEAGRMALIQDPIGAMFAIWEPRAHHGAARVNEPGAFCWNELQAHDCAAAEAFYTALFGWLAETDRMPDGHDYTTFFVNGHMNAGMLAIRPEWGEMPSNWAVYFAVADCDTTAARASELGGTVCMPPRDIPDVGRFAVLQDPHGAAFSIIRLLHSC